jgi:hypothetical protein
MRWYISVFSADGRLIFAGGTTKGEAHDLATEARRLNRAVRIFLRSPTGQTTEIVG